MPTPNTNPYATGQDIYANLPWANYNPRFQSTTTPYWTGAGPQPPGSPANFSAPLELTNVGAQQTLQRFDPLATSPYGAPPGQGGLMESLQALSQMAGGREQAMPTFGRGSVGLEQQQTALAGQAGQSQLVQAEPQRLAGLLATLMSLYGLRGQLAGEQMREEAVSRQQKTQLKEQQRQLYGQIPIVGPLIGGIV